MIDILEILMSNIDLAQIFLALNGVLINRL